MGFEDEAEYQQYLGDLAYAEMEWAQIADEASSREDHEIELPIYIEYSPIPSVPNIICADMEQLQIEREAMFDQRELNSHILITESTEPKE